MPSIAVEFFFFLHRIDKYRFDLPITVVLFCDVHAAGDFQTIFANREALWVERQPKPAQWCHKTSINPWARIYWLCFLPCPFEIMPCKCCGRMAERTAELWFSVWTGESCCTTDFRVGRVQTNFFSLPSARLACAERAGNSKLFPQKNIKIFPKPWEEDRKICTFLTGMLIPSLGSSSSPSVKIPLQQTSQNSHFRVALEVKYKKGFFTLLIQYLFKAIK